MCAFAATVALRAVQQFVFQNVDASDGLCAVSPCEMTEHEESLYILEQTI